jgi:glyoxylase-like metal-dependent hydrolase (beta-lactamase superfamily II)
MSVLHTPGHTAGSICLYDDTDGVLVTGDCLIEGVIPYICTELNSPGDLLPDDGGGLEQFERSLDLLGGLPVKLMLPGHRAMVEKMKHYRARRRKRIPEVLSKKGRKGADPSGMSRFEVVKRLFSGPSIAGGALLMAISEVRGCLETMEKEGSVVSTLTNGKQLNSLRSIDHAKPVSIQYAHKSDL